MSHCAGAPITGRTTSTTITAASDIKPTFNREMVTPTFLLMTEYALWPYG